MIIIRLNIVNIAKYINKDYIVNKINMEIKGLN